MKFGTLYLPFDKDNLYWLVGPVNVKRLLLQFFVLALETDPVAAGVVSLIIHILFGIALVIRRPYINVADPDTEDSQVWDDLDVLAIVNSVAPAVLIITGLAANKNNGDAVFVVGILVIVFILVAHIVVFVRLQAKAAEAAKRKDATASRTAKMGAKEAGSGATEACAGLFSCCSTSAVTESAEEGLEMAGNPVHDDPKANAAAWW